MAERRMFAKTIVLSDLFLDMPMSARCLYFTLGMFADDDGFLNSPKSIMRQCGASQDDMNILIAKRFVLLFDSGIIVIRHWRLHNYIRQDTYNPTKCQEEMGQIYLGYDKTYERLPSTSRGRNVDGTLPQDSIGKVSIGKDNNSSLENEEDNNNSNDTKKEIVFIPSTTEKESIKNFFDLYNSIDGVTPCEKLDLAKETLVSIILLSYEPIDITRAFRNLQRSHLSVTFEWFINVENFKNVFEGNI